MPSASSYPLSGDPFMKESMTKVALLAIVLLVAGTLFVPAVSAYDIPFSDSYSTQTYNGETTNLKAIAGGSTSRSRINLHFDRIQDYKQLHYAQATIPFDFGVPQGEYRVKYTNPKGGTKLDGTLYISYTKNILGQISSTKLDFVPDYGGWDIGIEKGIKDLYLYHYDNETYFQSEYTSYYGYQNQNPSITATFGVNVGPGNSISTSYVESYTNAAYQIDINWHNDETDPVRFAWVNLTRELDTPTYSELVIYSPYDEVVGASNASTNYSQLLNINDLGWLTIDMLGAQYEYFFQSNPPPTAEPTTEPTTEPTVGQPVLRNGTVTMTDHNGTTITGFEVTAVNAYTDQSYTVATDTDVAVMTLPMERTTQIRNPQTGVYEEAAIGYYRFYGQSPGYKMLYEDGIQVAVMPEKYGSYQLCDIGVTSESGPLTGKHQFQIRSRSDNSILQTGTVSAKSATTGEWYNTTVSGGLATLTLAYDTSNPISQYAGNYYVYPTSPGYEDNDYGTQITVMPHTVSETKIIYLTPIGGIPTPGNVTLRIQAFSETGPGVVNAEIFVAGVLGAGSSVWDTYTASSTGYLTVSVPGNSTYDIVARGAGYYDSARRIEVFAEDPPLIEIKLYLSGAPTLEPTTQPTGWPTDHPTTQPTGGIPDEDDESEGFLIQAVRGIGLAFGVGFSTAKLIFGMLLALSIGYATAKQLRGGAAEFGLGLLGGTLLGVLIGLLPVWIIVVLLLVVGLYIGNRYVGGSNSG